MPARVAADVLDLPAPHGTRLVALTLLDAAAAARRKLDEGVDPEALHDFRVALRRLRSWLRAFRPHLKGSVRGKERRRLQALADATGASRDAEVHLEWLREQRRRATPR
jgi:CHAD domain-containing protein